METVVSNGKGINDCVFQIPIGEMVGCSNSKCDPSTMEFYVWLVSVPGPPSWAEPNLHAEKREVGLRPTRAPPHDVDKKIKSGRGGRV